ncbi:MAG: LysE family translocator, partial [Sphingomonadales bacterium]|nr:LysE family translocator [Sphingomonadales bacterium]
MIDTLLAFPPSVLWTFLAGALVLNLTPGQDVLFSIASGLQGGPLM